MNIESIINTIKSKALSSAIHDFQQRKVNKVLKPLAYTSFDGDYMHFLSNMLTYAMTNGYLPINPESALGYYVSTTTHQGNKIQVMKDCLCVELLCDEMWVFSPVNGHMPEGVVAEIMAWENHKGTSIRIIPFFNDYRVDVEISKPDRALDRYVMPPLEISCYLKDRNQNDIEDIRNKLFGSESIIPSPSYVVANFYNYKHIDWARSYCYQQSVCPVSPQNIIPYFLYTRDNKGDFELSYMIDRLTLMDKCKELLWFTNTKNLDNELETLDVFSCTELLYWYEVHGPESIKIVDWSIAGVPKYQDNSKWALTRTEVQEVQPISSHKKNNDLNFIRQKIFAYEKNIKDDFNIFKGDLLEPEACSFVTSNMNAFLFGLISDSSVKAEIAWSLPYHLKERLHHFDLNKIANMDIDELTGIIKEKPALHRYPSNIAKYLKAAAELLISKYESNASNIWTNGASAAEIVSRLEAFKGISNKKAALGSLLLVRDLGIDIKDKENINIAYDIHIRRICLRAGFCSQDTIEDVTMAGKRLLPEFPGRLTSSFWAIGRDICRPTNPLCSECPLDDVCEHNLSLGGDIHA